MQINYKQITKYIFLNCMTFHIIIISIGHTNGIHRTFIYLSTQQNIYNNSIIIKIVITGPQIWLSPRWRNYKCGYYNIKLKSPKVIIGEMRSSCSCMSYFILWMSPNFAEYINIRLAVGFARAARKWSRVKRLILISDPLFLASVYLICSTRGVAPSSNFRSAQAARETHGRQFQVMSRDIHANVRQSCLLISGYWIFFPAEFPFALERPQSRKFLQSENIM